ncbi:MAG: metal-sensitive transcriptional regulator [Anaerolineales bacterium]
MQSDIYSSVIARLSSAEGHLRAVNGMVESQIPSRIVLHQLRAVQGALKAVSKMIHGEYIEECLRILVTSDSPEESQQALDSLLELYNWSVSQK